jgi:UDP-N-acetylmuramate dehydrogenase
MMDTLWQSKLSRLVSNPVRWDCQLAEYTSFRIGGPAKALVETGNEQEISHILQVLEQYQCEWKVIGRGTNLLVRDEGFDGVIILLGDDLKEWKINDQGAAVKLSVGAGFSLSKLARESSERGFSGLEFAIGIPASVGGGVVMNAGAWGRSLSDIIDGLTVVTVEGKKYLHGTDLHFEYRRWKDMESLSPCVVTRVDMLLEKGSADEALATCRKYREQRKQKQPVGLANAGSIFKNPQGDSAGRLIEASGLKGQNVGDAYVSSKHANFIINKGNATATDVMTLMTMIQEKVFRDSGIRLQPEVHVL